MTVQIEYAGQRITLAKDAEVDNVWMEINGLLRNEVGGGMLELVIDNGRTIYIAITAGVPILVGELPARAVPMQVR